VAAAEPTAAEVEATVEGLEVTVVATNDYSFEPAEIELKAGETVTLVLDSSKTFESHTLVIDELDGVNLEADGGIVASTEFTPLEPGTYTFYCSVAGHREEGMEGTLTVVK
jgi:plastocyanin